MTFVLFILHFLFLAAVAGAQSTPGTWSDKLIGLESPAARDERAKIDDQELAQFIKKVGNLPNREKIQKQLQAYYSVPHVLQSATLADGSVLELTHLGLNQATELTLARAGQRKVLLSNLNHENKNNARGFLSFHVSPDGQYVVVNSEYDGSIDYFRLFIIDLKSEKLIADDFEAKGDDDAGIFWTGPSRFAYLNPRDPTTSILVDLPQMIKTPVPHTTFSGTYPYNFKCVNAQETYALESHGEPVLLQGLGCGWQSQFRLDNFGQYAFLLSGEDPKILKYVVKSGLVSADPSVLGQIKGIVENTSILDQHFFIQTRWGADQKLVVLNLDGSFVNEMTLPSYASIQGIQRHTPGRSVELLLQSPVNDKISFIYDYTADARSQVPSPDFLMSYRGVQYVSEVRMVTARDGVLIPTRLVYAKDSPPQPNSPALIKVYGGFGAVGSFYPSLDELVREYFLNGGGILVTPIIRGGDEFGESWHQQATGLKKMTTFNDLIDVAQYLTSNHLSSPKKIIATGTSDGGLVVTAAALLSPESFGMVIPVSGIFDVLGMYRLNPKWVSQWNAEFGRLQDPGVVDLMKKYSPLEQTVLNIPQFLFIAGRNDTRVSFIHDLKMIQKIRTQNRDSSNVDLYIQSYAGHWIDNIEYQDVIAVREKTLIWTAIFRYLGWEL